MSTVKNVTQPSRRKKREHEAAVQIRDVLASSFPHYVVETGKSLLYKIEVDPSGQLSHEGTASPMRGKYAFQTDILISKGVTPLVVIELKADSFSSHDVINYSSKAARHKQIYPYLRYGFVVAGLHGLGRRLMTHNEAFDFALVLPDAAAIENDLVALARRQIKAAETLCELMRSNRTKIVRYEQTVHIDQLSAVL
ncbi:hypothetical protein [Bradyrhizobium sp. SYSU BS000235]|uniref:hypothetical protein n=1 Tax=Bradyrhizobium sp. SYSU BS000235 TaxID=3411332 RepID=UPI003C717D2C